MNQDKNLILERSKKNNPIRIFANQLIYFFYGNTAGFRNNFRAKNQLQNLQIKFNTNKLNQIPGDTKSVDYAKKIKNDGFVNLKKFVTGTALNAALDEVDSIFNDSNKYVTQNGAILHALLETEMPIFKKLFTESLQSILLNYYLCAFKIKSIRVWRNLHVESVNQDTDDVFSNTFHHDACNVNSLRVFILLKDKVTKTSGALRFHNKKDSKKIMRSGFFSRYTQTQNKIEKLTNPRTLKFFEGNAGDCVIINTQECLHAASIPKEGAYRDILQFEIYPDEGPIKKFDELMRIPPDKEVINLMHGS